MAAECPETGPVLNVEGLKVVDIQPSRRPTALWGMVG